MFRPVSCGKHHGDAEVEKLWELNLSRSRRWRKCGWHSLWQWEKDRLLVLTAKAMENSGWDLSLKQRGERLRAELTVEETGGGEAGAAEVCLPVRMKDLVHMCM